MSEQKASKVPQIRFKEFAAEWEEGTIGEVLSEKKRPIVLKDHQRYELITVKRRNEGVVSRGHLFGRDILVKNYSQLQAGDFVISKRQVVHGATGIVTPELDGAIVSNEYLIAINNNRLSTEFLTILASLPPMRRKFFLSSYGVDIEKLFFDAGDWKKRNITIPVPSEQTKISEYFREIDRVIDLHQRKHDKLLTLKKSMLQKMFPHSGATTPEIRFKGFLEEWSQRSLSQLAKKVTEKNVAKEYSETFTNSAEFGVVSQRDYFDKDISNAKNIGGYYVVEPECFVYNPRISALAPVGPINRNKLGRTGVMSPLYTVFRTEDVDNSFLEYFFKTNLWHPYMFLNGDTGARSDRFSIKAAVFFELPVPYPDLLEQQKIGNYFRTLDKLISKHATQLQKLQQIKTACLGKMFA